MIGKRSTSSSELALTFRQTSEQEASQVLLAGAQVFFLGDVKLSPHLTFDWLKISEIILTGCKTQMIIIIKTMGSSAESAH